MWHGLRVSISPIGVWNPESGAAGGRRKLASAIDFSKKEPDPLLGSGSGKF
jgi:hypothetical protein